MRHLQPAWRPARGPRRRLRERPPREKASRCDSLFRRGRVCNAKLGCALMSARARDAQVGFKSRRNHRHDQARANRAPAPTDFTFEAEKLGFWRHSWKRRFFVVSGNNVFYYTGGSQRWVLLGWALLGWASLAALQASPLACSGRLGKSPFLLFLPLLFDRRRGLSCPAAVQGQVSRVTHLAAAPCQRARSLRPCKCRRHARAGRAVTLNGKER